MIVYKYSQIKDRLEYDKMKSSNCIPMEKELHLGQLKLLISEIMFLTKKASDNDLVLYVGAAEGYHIYKLAEMFPTLTFDLWDPGKFGVDKRGNIRIFNRFFTNKIASSYVNKSDKSKSDILFISDIRSLEIANKIGQETMNEYNKIIDDDNNRQLKWVQIIKPKSAFLKFRPAYDSKITKYLDGEIYLQAYSPKSSETRLLTSNYSKLVDYDDAEFDEKMAYFNCKIRGDTHNLTRWKDIMDKYKIKNVWDNNIALYVLSYYLDKRKNIRLDDNKVGELFIEIIDFHKKKYHKKYDFIFTK